MRYAQVRHRQTHCAGHLWQGRFFSAPLDELYCARAMRYVEMNPQRAGLVTTPEAWPWSSAACHLQGTRLPGATFPLDDMLTNWSAFLLREELPGTLDTIRHCTASGRPLGDAAFYTRIEALGGKPLQRNLHRRPTKNT